MATKRRARSSADHKGRPMKKRTATTAGRGAEGEIHTVNNGRATNSQSVSQIILVHNTFPFAASESFIPTMTMLPDLITCCAAVDLQLTMEDRTATQMFVQHVAVMVSWSVAKVARARTILHAVTRLTKQHRKTIGTVTSVLRTAIRNHSRHLDFSLD